MCVEVIVCYISVVFFETQCSKLVIKLLLNISPRLEYITTIPCKISMFSNCHAEGLSATHCSVRLGHSKKSQKNTHQFNICDTEVKNNLHSDITRVKQFLSIISELSGQFFILKQDIARHTRQSTFLPGTLPNVPFKKLFATKN